MKKRFKSRKAIPRKKSRRIFKKGARRIHKKNMAPRPMRGGIRL